MREKLIYILTPILSILLTLIFVALKLVGVMNVDWIIIFLPLIIGGGILTIINTIIVIMIFLAIGKMEK